MSDLLPSKLVDVRKTVLGQGAVIIRIVGGHSFRSVGQLWAVFHHELPLVPFSQFVDALTMLYAVRVLDIEAGLIHRETQ